MFNSIALKKYGTLRWSIIVIMMLVSGSLYSGKTCSHCNLRVEYAAEKEEHVFKKHAICGICSTMEVAFKSKKKAAADNHEMRFASKLQLCRHYVLTHDVHNFEGRFFWLRKLAIKEKERELKRKLKIEQNLRELAIEHKTTGEKSKELL